MINISLEVIGGEQVIRKFEQLAEELASSVLMDATMAGALIIQNAAKENIREIPLYETGELSRSIHIEPVTSTPTLAEVEIGTDKEYAAIHEFGGTIVPKKAKALAIPLTDSAHAHNPRDFPGKLHVVPAKDGETAVLVDQADQAQYALVKRVTIPARPYMRPAVDENRDAVVKEIGSALRQLIERTVK